jgi:hypothetical protein
MAQAGAANGWGDPASTLAYFSVLPIVFGRARGRRNTASA